MDAVGPWGKMGVVLTVLAMLFGTASRCSDAPPGFSEFHGADRAERPRLLREYPAGQQIDLYLAAMKTIHPPQLGLADVIAALGKPGAVLIGQKLAASDSDYEKVDLSLVLVRMQELSTYDVRGDDDLREVHEDATTRTTDSDWRVELQEHRRRIGWEEGKLVPE
jgi:hypothetical protein